MLGACLLVVALVALVARRPRPQRRPPLGRRAPTSWHRDAAGTAPPGRPSRRTARAPVSWSARERAPPPTDQPPPPPAPDAPTRSRAAAYLALTKPRIIELLLVTTVPTMVLAAGGLPGWATTLATLVGGTLAAGSANTLNQVADRDIDAVMRRTQGRPIVTGEISPRAALLFGLGPRASPRSRCCWPWTTPLAAALAVLAVFFYAVVYTLVLKRRTSQNIVWGGAAGFMPVLIGWAAVTGEPGLGAGRAVRGHLLLDAAALLAAVHPLPRRLRRGRRADAPGRRPPPPRWPGRPSATPWPCSPARCCWSRWPAWARCTRSPRSSPGRCSPPSVVRLWRQLRTGRRAAADAGLPPVDHVPVGGLPRRRRGPLPALSRRACAGTPEGRSGRAPLTAVRDAGRNGVPPADH